MKRIVVQIEFDEEMPFDALMMYLNEMNAKQEMIDFEELAILQELQQEHIFEQKTRKLYNIKE